jgi:hypothetical protein
VRRTLNAALTIESNAATSRATWCRSPRSPPPATTTRAVPAGRDHPAARGRAAATQRRAVELRPARPMPRRGPRPPLDRHRPRHRPTRHPPHPHLATMAPRLPDRAWQADLQPRGIPLPAPTQRRTTPRTTQIGRRPTHHLPTHPSHRRTPRTAHTTGGRTARAGTRWRDWPPIMRAGGLLCTELALRRAFRQVRRAGAGYRAGELQRPCREPQYAGGRAR